MSSSKQAPEDRDLLARLATRDTDSFALIYVRHARLAHSYALRMLQDPRAAEMVVYEVFVSL